MAKGLCIVFLMAVAVVSVNGQGIIPGINNICFAPAEAGICRAFIPAFYFNPLSGACDCFIYGGCLGNNNRFDTLVDCMSTCSVRRELQFNTPSCNRIFGRQNPLESFLLTPYQPATSAQPLLPTSPPPTQPPSPPPTQPTSPPPTQPQQPTGIPLPPPSSSPKPQVTETQTEQPAPQPQEPAPRPQESAPQPQAPAVDAPKKKRRRPATKTEAQPAFQPQETSVRNTNPPLASTDESEGESSPSGGSRPRTVVGLLMGSSGVRPGMITIGQPVVGVSIGPSGVRPGTVNIGQPVSVSFNKHKEEEQDE